jgi:hypothetical protein
MANRDLPPDDSREAWIQQNVAALRRMLGNPEVRAELLILLNGDRSDDENR